MKEKVRIERRAFPNLMLGLIAFVYLLSFFCNSGFKEAVISSLKNHDHHSHDHHHGHEHKHTHDHDESKGNQSDNNCCNETTASFFASFNHNYDQKINLSKVNLISYIPVWNKVSFDKVSYSFKRFSPQFLKRKIPDIRILIQSFII